MGSDRRRRRLVGWVAACAALAGAISAHRAAATEYLVADQVGNRIVAFDSVTGAYKRTLWSSATAVQPASMTFGPGGDLYFANRISGEVMRIPKANLGATLTAATPFATGIDHPGSLAYHAGTDSLLVGEFGTFPGGPLGDEIFVYNAAGAKTATLTLSEVGIAGIAFDSAGDLFASGFFTNPGAAGRVYKFSGPPTWQSQGPIAPTAMEYPWPQLQGAAGIAFTPDGAMYVAGLITANAGDVVRFVFDQGQVVDEQRVGDFIPFPSGLLAVDANQLLVTSLGFGPTSGTVYRFNPTTGARSALLLGDFSIDVDVVVDATDLGIWQSAFEISAEGDADFDGDSDGADLLAWQRGLGSHGAPGLFSPSAVVIYNPSASSGVPEPASAALASVALLIASAMRRRIAHGRNRRALT